MSSKSDEVLQDLLKQPFGPYLDETILSKKCKHTSSKRLLLENLMLSYKDKPTGFDRTEFEEPFVPSNAAHLLPIESGSRVLFRGVLSISAFTHLSDKGAQYLNNDFKERVRGSIINGIPSARKYSTVNMESIFELKAKQKQLPKAEHIEVRVLIQGAMRSSVSFMRSDISPDGLLFQTADTSFRVFEIASMDVETYKLSRTFLFRHHTLRTMRDILSTYKNGVPTYKRTPQWFLEHYFHGFAYPPHRRWSRINSLEDAESSDEGPNDPNQTSYSRPANAQTQHPRHLRIVHKYEVWSIFASHSEWIFSMVQNHKDLKGEVHSYAWESFLSNIPRLRKTAMSDEQTNGRWGLRDEQQEERGRACETGRSVSAVEVPAPTPKPRSISQITATTKKRKRKTKSPPAPPSPKPSLKRHRSTTTAGPSRDDGPFESFENYYDSDFSQISSSPSPPGSSHLPDILRLLPPEMTAPPALPANMQWHCTVGGGTCSYTINLCSLSQDNLRLARKRVPRESLDYVVNRDWKADDGQVWTVFYEIVNAHWEDHLRELDIEFVRGDDACTFRWIHPWRHPISKT